MSLSFHLKYYFYYLIAEYEGATTVIKITVLLATFLIVVLSCSILYIIILQIKYLRQQKILYQFNNFYRQEVYNILSSREQLEPVVIRKRLGNHKNLYNNANKKLYTEGFIEVIGQLKSSGLSINSDHLFAVLDHFQLPSYWQKVILKGRLIKRSQALRKMDQLEQLLSGSILLHSVYHNNKDFRKQSRAAFIEYDKNDPFRFFEESFDTEFNALDEIRLHHYLIKKASNYKLPDFSRWVENAENTDFKKFIIKEIGLLQQSNCAAFLTNLLRTENNLYVQKQIIETLGVLNYKEADGVLIAMYTSSLALLQKAIIGTLSKLKTEKTLAFLGESYQRSHDNSIKIQLAYALTDYGIEGEKKMEALSQISNNFDSKILAQVRFANKQKRRQTFATN